MYKIKSWRIYVNLLKFLPDKYMGVTWSQWIFTDEVTFKK